MTDDWTTTLPRKRMGAGVLFCDEQERVLLVEPTYKPDWEVPGGCVEADESPRAAAEREVLEELGLSVSVGRLLVTDWVGPRDGRTEGLMLIFDGGALVNGDPVRLPAAELRGWAWCTEPEAAGRLSPLLARRVAAAVRARAAGAAAYLENGYDVA
ncbi:NUDIX domain-containing protein [Actinoplanes xinjiangensis]|uniref:ADP-ribose pyrophosphatase YjhB (NUDIX family) n=1 Tax=Actinoplanes xinjiangensis TaxID=512350 RepID=A0A316F9E8_9ACTN|nr:NUDIX hydrolase [Actinoplanes xinjiangensis]PWK44342.1 ADP-ribose pyrophosphatase YjhB (NUDIX family) [Actinoplanes xinjiangensis]GIF37898.1 hypothetical protein Axi01nite_22090 [Actinoplanes xinjiangensis]